ncbi:WD repeat-containing protein VIP3-like [Tripterygium wilfordii]|uniref:WD repeat-containing protein VIP3-like n=1 Tax=Tripterygium wilfordii TaxID=458696 RepID=UPI0018F7E6B1|nr:WD repeat-containing protein VIP3-like [Tripterygium wilfordii]
MAVNCWAMESEFGLAGGSVFGFAGSFCRRFCINSRTEPRVLFTASDDTHVHIYDSEGKALITALSGHTSWVLSVDGGPDGLAIATGSSDKTVRLWDLNMRAAVQTMTNHSDKVWGVAFWPPGGTGVRFGRLASVSDDEHFALRLLLRHSFFAMC